MNPAWRNCASEPDDEIREIDAAEAALAPLDERTRHIRRLITSHESCHHKAERHVEHILQAIGGGEPAPGPGRRSANKTTPREELWRASHDVLLAWCEGWESERERREIVGLHPSELTKHLGARTPLKVWQVQRVATRIGCYLDPKTMWRPSVIADTQWQGEDAAFHRLTRETLIHDTIDGQQAQISVEAAIDCLNGCNWNFPNNLVIILRAIGGDLYPSTPFAACGRNVHLVPSRDRMRVVVNTLSLFCGQSGAKADQTNPAILARWGMPPRPSVGSPPRSRRRWNCNSIYRAGLPFSSAGPVPSSPPGKSGNRSFALAPPARQPD